ncbi:VWA domain-containing protein [Saccharopolyspora griseoalba]|uniref:VWA domain-containing protein n=1 Tax=Saccharopolyspora griseoalba TaxID=1431848 RepID=A0ABW2LLU8_9PSEU
MESALHRFVRLLRLFGMRISVSEATDAMRCAAQPGMLDDRESLRAALKVAMVKDRRDEEIFDEVYDAFFALRPVVAEDDRHGHGHEHDDLSDTGELQSMTVSEEPAETPQKGHNHDEPVDIRDYFDPEDLAQQYNLHQESNKVDLASMTEEMVFSKENSAGANAVPSVQVETEHLHNAGSPGSLAEHTGTRIDTRLSIAEERTLLDWLADEDDAGEEVAGGRPVGFLENLPELLQQHLAKLAELESTAKETREVTSGRLDRVDEAERQQLEESLRRIVHSLRGAPTSRRRNTPRGRVHPARTMRRNMRYDGVPFRPVTVRRAEDKPRLVVLADVSLSVRSTARFTLHLVHGLQALFAQVRTFAFVDDPVEITELFAEHPLERALGLVFDGLPQGGVLDVDGNSDYGTTFAGFLDAYGNALNRRTTVLVLGDGRGNGNDPNVEAFGEIARRARETIWLTPEPRYSWRLGRCDLPDYAEHCDRVRVVRDLSGLARAAETIATGVTGR